MPTKDFPLRTVVGILVPGICSSEAARDIIGFMMDREVFTSEPKETMIICGLSLLRQFPDFEVPDLLQAVTDFNHSGGSDRAALDLLDELEPFYGRVLSVNPLMNMDLLIYSGWKKTSLGELTVVSAGNEH